ncbi:MAG: hypothetical protein LBS45_12135 [Synergistaceae bacterium]|jgi:hypothetical protein|nr:hypothetical protein [Synergistaceae bacterium]
MGWKRKLRESRAKEQYIQWLEKRRGGNGAPILAVAEKTDAVAAGDGISPFVRIRDGEGAWNDYAFNILMFFFVAFGYGFAALKAIAYLCLAVGVIAFIVSLL